MELSTFPIAKMEAKMEVSKPELYYSVILCVCEHEKVIVCGIFAIDIENGKQIRGVSAKFLW